jgi:PhoH-like ATPase|tara:strand:+ start:34511 stop:35932 length:1422 start_codon:yes stop_codon:yes gene_type:complete
MKKVFVLDTNVLVHDPYAFLNFDEHDIILPMTVLEELDSLKDRRSDVSKDARVAIRALEVLTEDKKAEDLTKGFPITTGDGSKRGTMSVFNDLQLDDDVALDTSRASSRADNSIINTAIYVGNKEKRRRKANRRQVVLVTKDINMRVKAKSAGLDDVEDYKNDQVLTDSSLMDKGYVHWTSEIRFWDAFEPIGDIITKKDATYLTLSKQALDNHEETKGRIYPNTYIIDEENESAMRVVDINEKTVTVKEMNYKKFMNRNAWNAKPKCFRQAAAIDALLDPDISLVTLVGAAGSGKTFLAVIAALQQVVDSKLYDKIILTRSTPDVAEGIGYLPGNETEKMAPWLAAFGDTMEAIHKDDEDMQGSIRYVTEKANIQYKSINFIRGRSINGLVILDEIQNLTAAQIKTVFSRMAEGSKIIALGNSGQVDVPFLNALNNGAVVATETFKNFEGAAHICLNGVVRSKLAAFTEENM